MSQAERDAFVAGAEWGAAINLNAQAKYGSAAEEAARRYPDAPTEPPPLRPPETAPEGSAVLVYAPALRGSGWFAATRHTREQDGSMWHDAFGNVWALDSELRGWLPLPELDDD